MTSNSKLAEYLYSQIGKPTLRFLTCGSVDDGKSTLLGRLLHESKAIFDDQLQLLENESKQYGTQAEKIDFALLVDGLQAEREQGITIDVAYRYFVTEKRRFIAADTPGHEQYTRNTATGASKAQLAVLLVDARKGIVTQTRRHSRIVAMMGIRHVVLAVNKIDMVDFDCATFKRIADDFLAFSSEFQFASVQAIPICALDGDNIVVSSRRTPWYSGPTLMSWLESVEVERDRSTRTGFAMPVQYVNRPNSEFRGFCGRIAEGEIHLGDQIRILPSGVTARVKSILRGFEPKQRAFTGEAVTMTLDREVDVSRGDVLAASENPPELADQFEAQILWMGEHPLLPGRRYICRIHTKEVSATVTHIKYRLDVNTGAQLAAETLALNEIGMVNLSFSEAVVFEPYTQSRAMGGFIMIEKLSLGTVGAGMIQFALRRATNIHWQAQAIDKLSRAAQKHQRPRCVWFTGLSGAGKSTLASRLEARLYADGRHTYVLDGDNIRHGLNRDLGFTEADRVENIRRVAEVARLMVDAGLVVLVSFISPFRADREMARSLFEEGEFIEVYMDTPLKECERRDPKGLYAKVRRGELKNFTGVDSVYEPPESPEVHIRSVTESIDDSVNRILAVLGT